MIVGLTGGIASGKSSISRCLVEQGMFVLDADVIAREVVAVDSPGLQAVIAAFGAEYLLPSGDLDRARLGERVFADATMRQRLNEIIHPLVRERMWEQARAYVSKHPEQIAILDIPLLFEGRTDVLADVIVLVYAPESTQLQRLMRRNGLDLKAATQRIRAQMSIEDKRRRSDVIVYNVGDEDDVPRLARELRSVLRRMAAGGTRPGGAFDRATVRGTEIH